MNIPKSKEAIGIFDSGAGGLTVAAAVRNLLPDEKIFILVILPIFLMAINQLKQ